MRSSLAFESARRPRPRNVGDMFNHSAKTGPSTHHLHRCAEKPSVRPTRALHVICSCGIPCLYARSRGAKFAGQTESAGAAGRAN